jgi:hypothetical protein
MRAIDPNGAFGDDYDDWVPDWSDLTFSMIRDGSGSLGFTVPVDGDGVARALALQVVVLLFDGAEPRNGRFIRRNRSPAPPSNGGATGVSPTPARKTPTGSPGRRP